ncbi:MAG: acyltransferase [Coraliomargarita sp. TMED73]|jgi:glucan biosynthesis protein C|nr:MAG: acyltransferase [Coraliomargarita sp. TMED73]
MNVAGNSDQRNAPIGSRHQTSRQYDVDWMRTIALILLIGYHGVISFQFWAAEAIYFIENEEPLTWLWIPMELFNIWRIPLLFFISGMGIQFAMERRSIGRLLADRTWRILFPAVIGFFLICPINLLLYQNFYQMESRWIPNPGHLWFLFNIFIYFLLLLPCIVLIKRYPHNSLIRWCQILTAKPWTLLSLLIVPFALEGYLLQPEYFSLFVMTRHGFFIGMLCFFSGFFMACSTANFLSTARSLRFVTLITAVTLYAVRLLVFRLENTNNLLNGAECILWILACIGYSSTYLNANSRTLQILSPAVYPIYILHLPVQFALASIIFHWQLPALQKLGLLLVGTFISCWGLYEVVRRVPLLRPIFGMKYTIESPSELDLRNPKS